MSKFKTAKHSSITAQLQETLFLTIRPANQAPLERAIGTCTYQTKYVNTGKAAEMLQPKNKRNSQSPGRPRWRVRWIPRGCLVFPRFFPQFSAATSAPPRINLTSLRDREQRSSLCGYVHRRIHFVRFLDLYSKRNWFLIHPFPR